MYRGKLLTLVVLLVIVSVWNWMSVLLIPIVSIRKDIHTTPPTPFPIPTTTLQPLERHLPPPKDGLENKIVDMARNLTANSKGPLLLTIINMGYLPLTYNWLCHTVGMKGVHENLIFMVQGEDTELQLKRHWPNVKTITVNQSANELQGTLKFGTVGYVRMMVRRTDLLNSLIQSNISFVLFETDFIWFENPVPDLIRMGNEKDLDIVGTISTAPTQLMCGALIHFRNTARTRKLWGEVTRQMHELARRVHSKSNTAPAPFRENEQVYLNHLLEAKYEGARYGLVPYETVVDGRWYHMNSLKRNNMTPKAIHNNFLDTTKSKMRRFMKYKQWVLNRHMDCYKAEVSRLMQRRPKGKGNNDNNSNKKKNSTETKTQGS